VRVGKWISLDFSGKTGKVYLQEIPGLGWREIDEETICFLKLNQVKRNTMKECDVKLYALSTCIHCRNEKEFLKQCGINFDCVDVDKLDGEHRRKILEEIRKINPECAFPTLVVGDKVVVGFKKDEIKETLDIP
jgi:glutaredoxin-like protein NrdH